jgi:hypothetical protein
LSWFIDAYRSHRTIRHDGEDVGIQSDLILLPDQSLAVIVLANTIPAPVNALTNVIVDLLLGLEPEFPRPPVLMTLADTLAAQGTAAAAAKYRHLLDTAADQYDFGLEQFLEIAYTMLEVRRYDEGLRVAGLGLELFPDSQEMANLLEQIRSGGNRDSAI